MNYNNIKELIGRFIRVTPISPSVPLDVPYEPEIVSSIHNALKRINDSTTVDTAMKEYANRLVGVYLVSITGNYHGCLGRSDETANRLGRTIADINNEILSHIEGCLVDIEHGAVFKDNLSDVFLSCMIAFEQKLESRTLS